MFEDTGGGSDRLKGKVTLDAVLVDFHSQEISFTFRLYTIKNNLTRSLLLFFIFSCWEDIIMISLSPSDVLQYRSLV
jgi:hypothetical protein